MKFTITSGNPTPQEVEAIREALIANPPEKLEPVINMCEVSLTITVKSVSAGE